jgi:hypothetical protein
MGGCYIQKMQYVGQQDKMGCGIAALAMVLDMTYEQVAAVLRLPDLNADLDALLFTGCNSSAEKDDADMEALARIRGKKVVHFDHIPELKPGSRYLGVIPVEPYLCHIVAIDERGIVFDPTDVTSREPWQRYIFAAVLEFQPL